MNHISGRECGQVDGFSGAEALYQILLYHARFYYLKRGTSLYFRFHEYAALSKAACPWEERIEGGFFYPVWFMDMHFALCIYTL